MTTSGKLVSWPLSDAQMAHALEHIRASSPAPVCHELILCLGVYCGLRAHEIARLDLDMLCAGPHGIADHIHIDRRLAKYSRPRDVAIPPRVREALIRFRTAHPQAGRVCDGLPGYGTSQIQQWLATTLALIGYVAMVEVKLRFPVAPGASTPGKLRSLDAPGQSQKRRQNRNPAFRQTDLVRAIGAAKRAGLEVTATEIATDGTIKLAHQSAPPSSAAAYDKWKERRDARSS